MQSPPSHIYKNNQPTNCCWFCNTRIRRGLKKKRGLSIKSLLWLIKGVWLPIELTTDPCRYSFVLFFKFVELLNFDVASDAFSTFKDLLTKHVSVVSEFLTAYYDEFFDIYKRNS
ncbi:hypothetical protein GLYMA_07G107050v4 [Glycine max]|nr:hypothetical protein GLYMA_07G107050v4 [Glycine max]KAH1086300.1 hypothetical protein GYH30_018009 [Glycine max]